MTQTSIRLIGAPVDSGKTRNGCVMGPDALRCANLVPALRGLGHDVVDLGNAVPDDVTVAASDRLYALPETIGWTQALSRVAEQEMAKGLPVFLGGDHSLSLGTVHGVAAHAAKLGRPLFVLWLDAHSDINTPETTRSGNLHGCPVAYLSGRSGFDGFPEVLHPVPEDQICLVGLRSVDAPEQEILQRTAIHRYDMRAIDEGGIKAPITAFLDRVRAQNGLLHVSLDVDFLDPGVAPAVGTTVPGGATVREAHLVMELLHDSGLMSALDVVELNPMLDERGRTAQLMVDLVASALGRRVFDRPTPRIL